MEEILEIGTITHFFSKISVAIVELKQPLSVGDHILVKGPTTDFEMNVGSIQIEHKNMQRAEAGEAVGLKLESPAKVRDVIYKRQ